MTEQLINKAIASHVFGWEDYDILSTNESSLPTWVGRKLYGASKTSDHWTLVPDYYNDLNAMHEAMEFLTDEQVERVWETLCDMIPFNPKAFRNGLIFDAPSQLRAEAYLRVLNKWESDS